MKKRILSLLLVLCMVFTFIPVTAGAAELIKLDTPTELEWGKDYGWYAARKDPSNYTENKYVEVPGIVSWKINGNTQNEIRLAMYNSKDDSFVTSVRISGSSAVEMQNKYDSFPLFLLETDLPSGTFYFTVESLGDGTTYDDSEIAKSGDWSYVRPDAALKTVTPTGWEWPKATWTAFDDASIFYSYEVQYLYAETLDEEPHLCGMTYGLSLDTTGVEIYDYPIQKNGPGYYYYQVRVLSNDITKYQNSEWSRLSEPYHLTDAAVSDALEDILASDSTDVRQDVQAMDTQALKDALLAEQDGSVSELLADLEEKVGGAATVETKDDFDKMDTSKVSIVGANLNTTGENKATLNIGNAEKEHVIEEQYQNAVAFSMKLDGVEDEENLAVPVKITMPIPASINPDFLVILHYHNDGSIEYYEMPYVFQGEDGQWYVSIVVTSFSDFIMAQQVTNEHDLFHEASSDQEQGWSSITEKCSHCDHTAEAKFTVASEEGMAPGVYTYTGKAIEPISVTHTENWLSEKFTITYENNINVGEASVCLSGGGIVCPDSDINIGGTIISNGEMFDITVPFTIAKAAEHTLTLNDLNQTTGSLKPVTATISPVDPTAQITVEYGITSPAAPCTHTHDESCSYAEGSACTHTHEETCGYAEDAACNHAHDETCGYVEAAACAHAHSEACGYAEEATVWTTEMPSAVGSYPVRAWLTASDNVEVPAEPIYTTGELNISAPYYGGGVSVPSKPAENKPEADEKNEEDKPQTTAKTFADVAENAWYNEAVAFVTESGLMNGVSDSTFAPENTVTRNMVMTVLARMAGIDTEGGVNWYEKAMNWAKEQGITDGSNAEGTITREQLVTMLYRYMKTPKVKTDLRKYTDADSVSKWAVNAFVWAVENGIITGMTETTLGATGATTRAQLATILMRFSEMAK